MQDDPQEFLAVLQRFLDDARAARDALEGD